MTPKDPSNQPKTGEQEVRKPSAQSHAKAQALLDDDDLGGELDALLDLESSDEPMSRKLFALTDAADPKESTKNPDASSQGKEEADPSFAQFFGPYQVLHEIGEGGVARVFRGRHIHPAYGARTFAIKVLHPELSKEPRVVSLFRHEAYILSLLKHANIVETFEAGDQDGELFIAMEYIEGRDVFNLIERAHREEISISKQVILHIVAETLRALVYAHKLCDSDGEPLDLIHRDVNPSNVFLSYRGTVKLGDFGVAAMAAGVRSEGELAGKPGYFAPEQLEGLEVDQRVDVFAVGVMLFEMLSGTHLFDGNSDEKIIKANRKAKIPNLSKLCPDIDPGLAEVVHGALARDPKQRIASVVDLLQALKPYLPEPEGMDLAVAACMRMVFLQEHLAELKMVGALAGGAVADLVGSAESVAICSNDPKARGALGGLLQSKNYRVQQHADLEDLAESVVDAPPKLLLVHLLGDAFRPEAILRLLAAASLQIPVVAIADTLDNASIARAHGLESVDLLFRPFSADRVLAAVYAALRRWDRVGAQHAPPSQGQGGQTGQTRLRVLLLAADPDRAEQVSLDKTLEGMHVEYVVSMQEAILRTQYRSYDAVVADTDVLEDKPEDFVDFYRKQPGMGRVPFVLLADLGSAAGERISHGDSLPYVEILPDLDDVARLRSTLMRLCVDKRRGRTFTRYRMQLNAEVRYGGRVFVARVMDLSRNGAMIQCSQMPPVGREIGLVLHLPKPSGLALEIRCRLVRVDIPVAEQGDAGLGVLFEQFSPAASEEAWIEFVAQLHRASPAAALDLPHQV